MHSMSAGVAWVMRQLMPLENVAGEGRDVQMYVMTLDKLRIRLDSTNQRVLLRTHLRTDVRLASCRQGSGST